MSRVKIALAAAVAALHLTLVPFAATGGETAEVRDSSSLAIPALVARQPPEVREAWAEINAVIDENARRDQPLPEPYFARAEMWLEIGDADAGLRDFLKATRLAESGGRDPATLKLYYSKLQSSLEEVRRSPRPAVAGDASVHFGRACHALRVGDSQRAERLLSDAIQLAPDRPLFWYYRAVLYKRLGDDDSASHDALIGADLEARLRPAESIDAGLSSIQGSVRQWLETYRRGTASGRLPSSSRSR